MTDTALCSTCGCEGDPIREKWVDGLEGPRCSACNTKRNQLNEQLRIEGLERAIEVVKDVLPCEVTDRIVYLDRDEVVFNLRAEIEERKARHATLKEGS